MENIRERATKYCPSCKQTLPRDSFGSNRAQNDGLTPYCKPCFRIKRREDYARRKDTIRDYHTRYLAARPHLREQQRQRNKRYYAANRERVIAKTTKYLTERVDDKRRWNREAGRRMWATDPEKARMKARVYREANREQYQAWLRAYRQRRWLYFREVWRRNALRRKKAMAGQRVDYAAIWERDRGICYLCGLAVARENLHFDHIIPLARGGSHTEENIAVTHSWCNLRKGAKMPTQAE